MADKDAFGDEANVTPETLRTFAEALKRIAARYETLADAMANDQIPAVRVKNLKTGIMSLVGLGKFVGATDTACCDALSAGAVEGLEPGMYLLEKYLKRTTHALESPKLTPNTNEQAAADVAVATAEHKHARDKKRDKVPRKR